MSTVVWLPLAYRFWQGMDVQIAAGVNTKMNVKTGQNLRMLCRMR